MTTNGEPPSGDGGVNEPDWIDQILERATRQVDAAPVTPLPVVPEPAPRAAAMPVEPVAAKRPSPSADSLADIRWVDDTPQVTPASTPVVAPAAAGRQAEYAQPAIGEATPSPRTSELQTSGAAGLVPSAVGRSAWDDQLSTVGDSDPEGWDKLSWQDLDEEQRIDQEPLHEATTFGQIVREWGPVLFAAVAIALFVRLVLVQAYHIPSASMVPTLEEGDRVVVNRLSYQFGEIERGQVVVFAKPSGTEGENDLIKRVIGLPGETVRFQDNQVYINGLRLDEPYLAQQDSTRPKLRILGCAQSTPAADRCVVPDGFVFVMGDNRLGSSDSRVFGPIEIDSVVGRAFMRVWPLNNMGPL